jgi:hypothetical protein
LGLPAEVGGKYLSAFSEKDFTTPETKFGGVWATKSSHHQLKVRVVSYRVKNFSFEANLCTKLLRGMSFSYKSFRVVIELIRFTSPNLDFLYNLNKKIVTLRD